MNLFTQLDRFAGWWLDWRTEQAMKANTTEEPQLLDFGVSKERGMEITMTHPGLAALTAECSDFLAKSGASNYVQMELQPRIDRGQRSIVFTVAYKDGEMPATKAARLEKEKTGLSNRIERTISILRIFDTGPAKYASDILKGQDDPGEFVTDGICPHTGHRKNVCACADCWESR